MSPPPQSGHFHIGEVMALNLPERSGVVRGTRAQLPQAGQGPSQWFCVSGDMYVPSDESPIEEVKTGSGEGRPSPGPLHLLTCHRSVSDRHMCVVPSQINRRVRHLVTARSSPAWVIARSAAPGCQSTSPGVSAGSPAWFLGHSGW